MLLTRGDGAILEANDAAARIFGVRSRDELLGRRMQEFYFDPAERAALAEAVVRDRVLTTTREVRFRRADGHPVWALANVTLQEESPSGPISPQHPVRHHRPASGPRAEKRDKLLAPAPSCSIERMPLAYILFDADFRITDWNPAAERILGYTREEALGKQPNDLNPPSFHAEATKILERIRSGDMAAHSVNENLTKDGRTITCEWFNTPLVTEDGRFHGLLCLSRDVTQQRSLRSSSSRLRRWRRSVNWLAG